MINKYRKQFIKRTVLSSFQLYSNNKILKLPVDVIDMTSFYPNIKVIQYSTHMHKCNFTYDEMIKFSETEDACTDYYTKLDRYIIWYNDVDLTLLTSNRFRWSIAHELGHVLLGHLKKSNETRIFRNNLTDIKYKIFEEEADTFAAFLLSPHIPLFMNSVKTKHELSCLCKISCAASSNRFLDYCLWEKRFKIDIRKKNIISPYDKDISELFPIYTKLRKCQNCETVFFHKIVNFCPVCRNSKLKKIRRIKAMLYKNNHPTNEFGRVSICAKCENEDVKSKDEFCKICGSPIVNKCIDCDVVADGNARYCTACGDKTTFFKYNVLEAYDYEKKKNLNFLPNDDYIPPF